MIKKGHKNSVKQIEHMPNDMSAAGVDLPEIPKFDEQKLRRILETKSEADLAQIFKLCEVNHVADGKIDESISVVLEDIF